MKIMRDRETVKVSDIQDLDSAHCLDFQSALEGVLPDLVNDIEIDLCRTSYVDCSGISALIGLRKRARHSNPTARICLRNASPAVQRLLRLTGLEEAFPLSLNSGEPGPDQSEAAVAE